VQYPGNYERAFEWLMGVEGFYSNHPADPGGETAWGISKRFWPQYWKDGPPTRDVARVFYYKEFWNPIKCNEFLNPYIAMELFEGGVLMGHKRAVSILQQAVNAIRFREGESLTVDGIMGPKTLHSANWYGQRYPEALYNAQNVVQGVFLIALDRPDFVRGWLAKRVQALQGE